MAMPVRPATSETGQGRRERRAERAAAFRGSISIALARAALASSMRPRACRETALQAREIDLAVHSYKDLPSESPDDLVVAAVPERVDAADVLVATQPLDRGLAGLPPAVWLV